MKYHIKLLCCIVLFSLVFLCGCSIIVGEDGIADVDADSEIEYLSNFVDAFGNYNDEDAIEETDSYEEETEIYEEETETYEETEVYEQEMYSYEEEVKKYESEVDSYDSDNDSEHAQDSRNYGTTKKIDIQSNISGQRKYIVGSLDVIKDTMIIVTDDEETEYEFTFTTRPRDLDFVKAGDIVEIVYTGGMMSDNKLKGNIISIEKRR